MSNFNQTFGCATDFDKLPDSAFDGYKLRCKLITKMGLNKAGTVREFGSKKLDYLSYFGGFTVEQLLQLIALTGKHIHMRM